MKPTCEYRGCACHGGKDNWFSHCIPTHKLVYHEVAKCASSTIKQVLPKLTEFDGEHWADFVVVRNPWDRMVSNFKMWTGPRKGRLRQMAGGSTITRFDTFVEFCETFANHHWAPQTDFFPIHVEYMFRLEQLQYEFDWFFPLYNMKPVKKMKQANKSKDRTHYTSFYNDALVDRVGCMYEADIQYTGYEFKGWKKYG